MNEKFSVHARKAARTIVAAGLAVLAAGACRAPKYAGYVSVDRDFKAYVPWGWRVVTDREGTNYANTTFIGPFDPAFYRGAPSLSVRWYAYDAPHRLIDGSAELYADADDFARQMLSEVYASQQVMAQPVEAIAMAGRPATHFVVFSPTPANWRELYGTVTDPKSKTTTLVRKHAYAILPLASGFYVLTYPATQEGFKTYLPQFNELVNTFTPLKDGPGGYPLQP